MARGTLRGAVGACLGLIALQAVSTRGGSGRVAELLGDVNTAIERLLDPKVPAIPNLAAGETWGGGTRPLQPAAVSPTLPGQSYPQGNRAPILGAPFPT